MSRTNKNHRTQMSFDNPEVEGEFLEDSADSMLSVSDSLGNMDSSDAVLMTEIDRSKLDDYSVNRDLDEEGAHTHRVRKAPSVPRKTLKTRERTGPQTKPQSEGIQNTMKNALSNSQLKPLVSSLMPLAEKAQEFLEPYSKKFNKSLGGISKEMKVRGVKLDKTIKTQPYLFALAAIVAGFALTRMGPLASSKR